MRTLLLSFFFSSPAVTQPNPKVLNVFNSSPPDPPLCCVSVLSPRCCHTMKLRVYRVSLCPLWSSCCFALMYSYRLPDCADRWVSQSTHVFPHTAQGFGLGPKRCGSRSQSWTSDLVRLHRQECSAGFIHVDTPRPPPPFSYLLTRSAGST